MNKFLKYIENGLREKFLFKDKHEIKKGIKKNKNFVDVRPENIRVIKEIKSSIKESGYRSIKISVLFRKFGYKKRGKSNTQFIKQLLLDKQLYCFPELDDSQNLWSTSIQIYSFPVKSLGDLFPSEKALEDFVEKTNALSKLKIFQTTRQYSPKRTKDKLDFKGITENENIVIELKNKDGGKSAVEQVLRYTGMLKQEEPNKKVRKILITGVRGLSTAKAIYGMDKEQKKNFEWYLYQYDKIKKTINFKRVTNKFIDSNLKNHPF